MALGAIIYLSLPFEPAIALVWCAIGSGLFAVWCAQRLGHIAVLSLVALIVCGLGAGLGSGKAAVLRAGDVKLDAPLGPLMVEGWVESIDRGGSGLRLMLKVHAVQGLSRETMPTRVRVTHMTRLMVEPGRFVRCWSVLRPPPSPTLPGDYAFDRQAYFEGLHAVGYVQGRCRGGTLGPPGDAFAALKLKVSTFRRDLAYHVKAKSGERAGGFAAALASGDRSFMAPRDTEALRAAGLAHLLAISGLHLGIVGGLVYLIVFRGLALVEPLALRFPVQKLAAAAALSAVACYLVISGASISTQRAFIMASVFFGAVLFDRTALSFRSFAIAMILVLCLEPASVLSPGFQMSFAATAGLIAAYQAWQRRRRLKEIGRGNRIVFAVQSLVLTSVIGAAATAPFAIYHFDRVAGAGLVANLLAMPVISFVSAPSAGAALVLAPFGLDGLALKVFGLSLEWVLAIAHWSAGIGGNDLDIAKAMPASTLALFVLAMIAVLFVPHRGWRFAIAALGSALGLVIWTTTPSIAVHASPSGQVYLRTDRGAYDAVELFDGDGLAPLGLRVVREAKPCSDAPCALLVSASDAARPIDPEDVCAYGRAQVLVFLAPDIFLPPACADQPNLIAAQEIISARGLSWVRSSSGFRAIPLVACGTRPWRPCPATDYE